MATLSVNIPRFYCFLGKEFLYDGQSHQAEFVNVCVFGVASIKAHALGFHALTDNGTVIWRLPLPSQSRCSPWIGTAMKTPRRRATEATSALR